MKSLYQQMIIDHSKHPCGFHQAPKGVCENANNPMCGDEINLCVRLEGNKITAIEYNASGCSISIAAASILSSVMTGKTVDEFSLVMTQYIAMLYGNDYKDLPQKLEVLSGVSQFPMRVKCASFVWHAAKSAIIKAMPPIELTEQVLQYWQSLVEEVNGLGIQLQFKQIGCMGWQFIPEVISEIDQSLACYDISGLKVLIDKKLISQIQGTRIDYVKVDNLGQSKVVYYHPKAKQHCGCGESFFIGEE